LNKESRYLRGFRAESALFFSLRSRVQVQGREQADARPDVFRRCPALAWCLPAAAWCCLALAGRRERCLPMSGAAWHRPPGLYNYMRENAKNYSYKSDLSQASVIYRIYICKNRVFPTCFFIRP